MVNCNTAVGKGAFGERKNTVVRRSMCCMNLITPGIIFTGPYRNIAIRHSEGPAITIVKEIFSSWRFSVHVCWSTQSQKDGHSLCSYNPGPDKKRARPVNCPINSLVLVTFSSTVSTCRTSCRSLADVAQNARFDRHEVAMHLPLAPDLINKLHRALFLPAVFGCFVNFTI